MRLLTSILMFSSSLLSWAGKHKEKTISNPNVIMILADDLGWNEVS